MGSLIARLIYRLLLLPLAVLLAPLLWLGGGLLALALAGEPAALWWAQWFPEIPGLYQLGEREGKDLFRLALGLAGVLSLSAGYFPIYDLWLKGCVPPALPPPPPPKDEVYIIP